MSLGWRIALVLFLVAGLGLPARASAEEVVLDNHDASVQVSGPWNSTALTEGFAGADYLYRTAGSGDGTVYWPMPRSLPGGRYEVFARWTSGPNRAANASYWITSDAGSESIVRNQQAGGGAWQSLGSFDFQAGKGHGVTLTDRADGVVVADAMRWVGPLDGAARPAAPAPSPAPAPASTPAPAPTAAPSPDPSALWAVTVSGTSLHAGPDADTAQLASMPQFSYLQVLNYTGDWAYVYNPRARGTAYVRSGVLGPSDAPPAWVTAPPPAAAAPVEQMGRSVGTARVAYYPVDDAFAYTTRLGHNVPILIHDRVLGPDGSSWYRVDQGYVQAASVRLPRAPEQMYAGRWIDADLSEPAMVTAYEGNRPVRNMLAIKGTRANQTPVGNFVIQRRVADETMNSDTIGIPRESPDGYFLEHVLFTQYFASDGASIHYNYWSSNFGYSGSHGCLGVNLEDAEYLWNWAILGTRVVIHS